MTALPDYVTATRPALALPGEDAAVVLAGPPAAAGTEALAAHRARVGALPWLSAGELVGCAETAGLSGRGGAFFPFARKLRTVLQAGGRPLVVVNASESEPASGKDRTLLRLRPHLVLDGAALAARAVGADTVVLRLHRGPAAPLAALHLALRERAAAGADDPTWRLSLGPEAYVSGESSAIVRSLEGGPSLPRWSAVPVAAAGVHGRPTLLSNVETLAQLATLVRIGPDAWRSAAPAPWTGPVLLTLHGAVAAPGRVVEVVAPTTVGAVLEQAGGLPAPPAALLVGGYAGTWLPGDLAWHLPLDRSALATHGASLGCGLLAVLPHGACGLAETARLARWLAGESAGQCGPCAFGLPRLATALERMARSRRGDVDAVLRLAEEVDGRGGCAHPDGVARLARSAVETFAADVGVHRRHRRCEGHDRPAVLPLPPRRRRS